MRLVRQSFGILVASALCVFGAGFAKTIAQDVDADVAPTAQVRTYVTQRGVSTPFPGKLELSTSIARYTDLSGEMRIEYVGQMPKSGGPETAGAAVYLVRNAAEYFALNKEREGCRERVRWLTVQRRSGYIRVGWLSMPEWQEYRPNSHGLCFAESRYLPESPLLEP